MLEYLNASVYGSWNGLTEALRTGAPQGGPSRAGGYAAFYENKPRLELFLQGMTGGSLLSARALAMQFPWQEYKTVMDIGVLR